jgi:SNF2 family DNA or RNA helicase
MAPVFSSVCRSDGVEIALIEKGLFRNKPLDENVWKDPPALVAPFTRRLLPLVDEGLATWKDSKLIISNETAAEFPDLIASTLGFPPLAPVILDIAFQGRIGEVDSAVVTEWKDANYRVIAPSRTGMQLSWGKEIGRLSAPLFQLIEATETFNRMPGGQLSKRVEAWSMITRALNRVDPDTVNADAYTKNLRVFQAGSFALDIRMTGSQRIDFDPVLMSRSLARSLEDNAPAEDLDDTIEQPPPTDYLADAETASLLTSEDHHAFLRRFNQPNEPARHAYPIRRNTYLLIDPDLRRALDIVKRMRSAPEEEKRAFVQNPRIAIARDLGIYGGDATATALFIETKQYSDRVTGLGVWSRPQLPWLTKIKTDWVPERFPVQLDGEHLEIERAEFEQLKNDVVNAEKLGSGSISFRHKNISVEAAKEIVTQVNGQIGHDQITFEDGKDKQELMVDKSEMQDPLVIQIKTNFEDLSYEIARKPRQPLLPVLPPAALLGSTALKPHQVLGFRWLVDAWAAGWPGVLLADDMGLGKTFQGLAFLAWIKENKDKARGYRTVDKGPILIVAPTALLANWIEEADKHLNRDALGNRADVFGSALKKFKTTDEGAASQGQPLDSAKLNDYDWILTTYETLADNHTSFARVRYSVALFDEVQKIKDPGTLNTWASKAMNADFVVGLTGTPIENRIEDLWSIMDRVFPGFLKDLKTFSKTHEDANEEKYRRLSDSLLKPIDGAPAIVLRRMKDDVLEALPPKLVVPYRIEMPAVQAQAYTTVVFQVHSSKIGSIGRGAMLEAIQKLRSVSLYPDNPNSWDLTTESGCLAWVERSARLTKTIDILRDVDRRGERALVFVEHRQMQILVADAISTLFKLQSAPFIINGSTPGAKRQKLVNAFQRKKDRFDLMILSPKAAGVGLNITAANHVIHLSRWWNPAVEDQCNDRVYRIGQNRPVTIHIPISVHPGLKERTFDVALDRLLERKREMSRRLLAPPVSDRDLDEVFADTITF